MTTSELQTYAVWFSIKTNRSRKLKDSLELLRNHLGLSPRWRLSLRSGNSGNPSLCLSIAPDFHLIHIEQHCSPGDICGALKHVVLSDPEDQVMAVRIAKDSYLPHHGMKKRPGVDFQRQLSDFMAIPEKYYLVRIDAK